MLFSTRSLSVFSKCQRRRILCLVSQILVGVGPDLVHLHGSLVSFWYQFACLLDYCITYASRETRLFLPYQLLSLFGNQVRLASKMSFLHNINMYMHIIFIYNMFCFELCHESWCHFSQRWFLWKMCDNATLTLPFPLFLRFITTKVTAFVIVYSSISVNCLACVLEHRIWNTISLILSAIYVL